MNVSEIDHRSSSEERFAVALQDFLEKDDGDILNLINNFKIISAAQALSLGEKLNEGHEDKYLSEEFSFWDLETRLWNLVEDLYLFRASEKEPLLNVNSFSSPVVKIENYMRQNPQIKELSLIIQWIQFNLRSLEDDNSLINDESAKWMNTRVSIQQQHLQALVNKDHTDTISQIDADAPIREAKNIDMKDEEMDTRVFYNIYRLVLKNKMQDAIDYANSTGNYTIALILIGATQDYIDPVVDVAYNKELSTDEDSFLSGVDTGNSIKKPSGMKHKLLWRKAVYKLSQQRNINHYERLIYNYLSAGDLSANLKETENSWEESLLLYLTQLYTYNMDDLLRSMILKDDREQETLAFPTPLPSHASIDEVLNTILRQSATLRQESSHPLRMITGSVMINKFPELLGDIATELSSSMISPNSTLAKKGLSRIITHLAIVHYLIEGQNKPIDKSFTKIITYYSSHLEEDLMHFVPLYLSFLPDRVDALEFYSTFLTKVVDAEKRSQIMRMSRSLLDLFSRQAQGSDSQQEQESMDDVLRRTVEKVIRDTESSYIPSSKIVVLDQTSDITETDVHLYRSVDWFYENSIHEDAIKTTIVVIRRFLLNGKLAALKQFAKNKDFRKLIKDYELEYNLVHMEDLNLTTGISEEEKEEFLNYDTFVRSLSLIDDWKQFLNDNQMNSVLSTLNQSTFWKSKHINNSIEKITSTLSNLLKLWLTGLISSNSKNRNLYEELRTIYVPYVIIELLQIYQLSRLNNWSYIHKAYVLITQVAREELNDYLKCFNESGRLEEFLTKCGELSIVASEKGKNSIFI